MSNLIKSGKVVELEVPVNVGISYAFDSKKKVIRENVSATSNNDISKDDKTIAKAEEKVQPEVPAVSKEEIINKYIEEAKKKAEEVYQAEMQRAYEEGMTRAKEDATKILEDARLQGDAIIDEIVKFKEDVILEYKEEMKSSEKELLNFSLDIVEKIINYEVNRSDDYVLGIVKDALDRVLNKKDVILKLSTADYYTVLSNKKYLVANVKGFGEIDIVQDESMEPGSCIVDTPLGVIDGGIQVRMDNIQKEIMKMLNEQ